MRYLRIAVASFVLVAALISGAQAQDAAAIEAFSSVRIRTDIVVGGFTFIRDLSTLGESAPSDSAQRAHIEAIILLLEGSDGPDVTLENFPRELGSTSWYANALNEVIDGRNRIRRGGLLGAMEDVDAQLDTYANFVREHAAALAAYYEAKYGWTGDLQMNGRLDRMYLDWEQAEELARFALEAALVAQQSDDPVVVESALLKISAFCVAVAGGYSWGPWMQPKTEGIDGLRPDPDYSCVLNYFLYQYDKLGTELLEALAASEG
jgi:hypothetical protein